MEIVTGHTGSNHITTIDEASKNQGIFGSGTYILDVGSKFSPTISGSTVTIQDGEGMLQGIHFRVPVGQVDTVTLDPGTAGMNRIDVICARFTRITATGVESVSWHVGKGTPTAGDPVKPSMPPSSVREGANNVYGVMFVVRFTGESATVSLDAAILPPADRSGYDINTMVGPFTVAVGATNVDKYVSGFDANKRYLVTFEPHATVQTAVNGLATLSVSNNNGSSLSKFLRFYSESTSASDVISFVIANCESLMIRMTNATGQTLNVRYDVTAVAI